MRTLYSFRQAGTFLSGQSLVGKQDIFRKTSFLPVQPGNKSCPNVCIMAAAVKLFGPTLHDYPPISGAVNCKPSHVGLSNTLQVQNDLHQFMFYVRKAHLFDSTHLEFSGHRFFWVGEVIDFHIAPKSLPHMFGGRGVCMCGRLSLYRLHRQPNKSFACLYEDVFASVSKQKKKNVK